MKVNSLLAVKVRIQQVAYMTLNFQRHAKRYTWILQPETTQQTRDVVPKLGQCWASVVDGGLALAQHRDNVLCLLGTTTSVCYC